MASRKNPNPLPSIKKGERFRDKVSEVRVMTVVEGWVVWRRDGCVPGLTWSRDFAAQFERIGGDATKGGGE